MKSYRWHKHDVHRVFGFSTNKNIYVGKSMEDFLIEHTCHKMRERDRETERERDRERDICDRKHNISNVVVIQR